MKKEYFDLMLSVMARNPDVYLIFVGLGYPRYDEFKSRFGDRAINTEASEQTAMDIAVGLAYENKIPFVYTITPFYYRAWETLRTYIDYEKLNVKMVGAGRDDDYSKHDGYSHYAGDINYFMNGLTNIYQLYPRTIEQLKADIDIMLKSNDPYFLSIRK